MTIQVVYCTDITGTINTFDFTTQVMMEEIKLSFVRCTDLLLNNENFDSLCTDIVAINNKFLLFYTLI